eukprot:SAG11_NODE_8494_length_1009_cov_1.298901_1_plen_123_part_10
MVLDIILPYGLKLLFLPYIVHSVVHPSRLHARIGRINFSKFLYVPIFPEYTYSIAQIQANTVSLCIATQGYTVCVYSEAVKPTVGTWKNRPSENPPVLCIPQYLDASNLPQATLAAPMIAMPK